MNRHYATVAIGLIALLKVDSALANKSCADHWKDKRWWNSGSDNNAWIKKCSATLGINPAWVDEKTNRQYVICYKFDSTQGPMEGHVYEPTYTSPVPNIASVPCIPGLAFSELLYKDCLTPEQPVKFNGAYVPIEEAARVGRPTVTTLATRPGVEGARLGEQPVRQFIATAFIGDIFQMRLNSGIAVDLTGNHPMVLSDGRIVQADTLRAGDALLRADGDVEEITSISTKPYNGNVWTVRPNSEKKLENVMLVNGLLTGSSHFTAQWAYDETRLVRARTIDIRGL